MKEAFGIQGSSPNRNMKKKQDSKALIVDISYIGWAYWIMKHLTIWEAHNIIQEF